MLEHATSGARGGGARPVIGREHELQEIERLLAGAREGFGALLLEGEAGIGKTTVFREALRRAEASCLKVLACRPGESEATLSFAALGDLLRGVPSEPWQALPAPQRRALEVALLQIDPGERPADRRAVAAGVRSLVARLASDCPVLLAIDDVQWLDPASAAALEFAIRRFAHEHIGVLATRRLAEPGRLDLEASVPREAMTRAHIGPLSLGALQRLVRERFGEVLPRSLLARIHSASRGNPLFALEIGRVLAERGGTLGNEPLPVPDDVRNLVQQRVVGLPDATRDLLLAAALLAEPAVDTLRRALGRSPDVDLEPAERAGIAALEGSVVVFAHPLHAAGVVAAATAAARRHMHMRLADAVGDPERRALHLAFGAEGPSAATAALLEQGAGVARGKGSLHAAAELLERARALTPAGDEAAARSRGIRAAELHLHAGDRGRSRTLLEALLAEPLSAAQRAEALRLLGELSFAEDDLLEAERLLGEALALADDPRSAARIRLDLAFVLHHRMEFSRGAEHSLRAIGDLVGCDDGHLLAEALAYSANSEFLIGRGVDWSKLERALELEDPSRIGLPGLTPRAVVALLHAYVGRHAEGRRQLEDVRDQLAERGDEDNLGYTLVWLSWIETRCGNFARAAEIADTALVCTSLSASHSIRRLAVAQRAWVAAHLGDLDDARHRCGEAAAQDRRGIASVDLWIAATLALAGVSTGDHPETRRATRELIETLECQGMGEPVPWMLLPDALEALVALGELDRAEALIDTFECRGRELDRSWALATSGRCRGLLLGARGDAGGALVALDRALAVHERLDMPFERARTLLVEGTTLRRLRRRARAALTLQEALNDFERMGAKLWAARARGELERVAQHGPRSQTDLTPSERRVGELVCDGLSNKEIASRLFVSVHTIEVHLSHAYTKLGVHSRAQLARRLAATHPAEPFHRQKP